MERGVALDPQARARKGAEAKAPVVQGLDFPRYFTLPGVDPFDAMVQTAQKLQASRLVTGVSARMSSDELARRIGLAWERLPEPKHPFSLEVTSPGRPSIYVNLGPHPPCRKGKAAPPAARVHRAMRCAVWLPADCGGQFPMRCFRVRAAR